MTIKGLEEQQKTQQNFFEHFVSNYLLARTFQGYMKFYGPVILFGSSLFVCKASHEIFFKRKQDLIILSAGSYPDT